ncbi:MAG TPA: hypothetical protein VGK85_04940 [Myxococcaceae bacterium]|jgi:hypothetical protein
MPSGPEQRFNMVGSGLQTSALITKDGAQGPDVNVGRFDDGKTLRGTVARGILQINVSGTRATGSWGNVPLNLDVEETADQLKMTGLIAGRPSTWTASADAVQGNIGFCAYDLRRQGDSYAGTRSCGRGIGQVTVTFPSTIHEWEPINIGVLMALLMATP